MSDGSIRSILEIPGFAPLWVGQCLQSFNDHCFKIVVSLAAVDAAARNDRAASGLPIVAAAFVLPFLLFSSVAGRLADTASRPRIIQVAKAVELAGMALGVLAFAAGNVPMMIGIVFLMGTQAAFYGPARSGFTPELVGMRALAGANGLFDMGSYLSIMAGTMAGTLLFGAYKHSLWIAGTLLTVLAVAGFLTVLRLPAGIPPAAKERIRILDGWRRVAEDRPLGRTVTGIALFWFLGALMQLLVLVIARNTLALNEARTGLLLASLAIGIGLGSFLAGLLSRQAIELGLVPIGGFGMAVSLAMLARSSSFETVAAILLVLGVSGGLWIVPLDAYLQFRTASAERGRVLRISALLNTAATLAAPALLLIADRYSIPVRSLLLFGSTAAFAAAVWSLRLNLRPLVRFAILSLVRIAYRIRIEGRENIPAKGGSLLVANHVSFVDGLVLAAATARFVRFLVIEKHYDQFKPLMEYMRAIPVAQGRPRDVVQMIAKARQELAVGHVVCIFPEGNLTRSGHIAEFQRGMERIAEGLNVPVIPIHLHGLWGSIFSYEGGRVFRKWPGRVPYPVRVTIGEPLSNSATALQAREAVVALGAKAARAEAAAQAQLQQAFVTSAKRLGSRQALADSTGKTLTFRQTLIASLMLSRRMKKWQGEHVGIVMPASVGGALVNIAALMAGKSPVNLNFTSGSNALESAIEQCGIRAVVTSRAFLAKARLEQRPGMIYAEDLLSGFGALEKLRAAAWSLLPAAILRRAVRHGGADRLATVLFSSGSSGKPKGVMLSHANLMSNIAASAQVINVTAQDRIAGVLPFFHSFGFNFTLWFPLVRGLGVVYHPNPIDAKGVGALVQKHTATLLLATPTFAAGYTRAVATDQFRSLRMVLVGAEKLRPAVADAFEAKFGVRPLEGYGVTEMAPVVAVNSQEIRIDGSVGKPLPGIAVRVVDPETREPLEPGRDGLLLVDGPNRMMGYLGDQHRTEEVFSGGWYNTGDIGRVDHAGFLFLTGRLSRFSKIAGEMVPHGAIEDALEACLTPGNRGCVVAIPDEERGEHIVALYTDASLTPVELSARLSKSGLPNLWPTAPGRAHISGRTASVRIRQGRFAKSQEDRARVCPDSQRRALKSGPWKV